MKKKCAKCGKVFDAPADYYRYCKDCFPSTTRAKTTKTAKTTKSTATQSADTRSRLLSIEAAKLSTLKDLVANFEALVNNFAELGTKLDVIIQLLQSQHPESVNTEENEPVETEIDELVETESPEEEIPVLDEFEGEEVETEEVTEDDTADEEDDIDLDLDEFDVNQE